MAGIGSRQARLALERVPHAPTTRAQTVTRNTSVTALAVAKWMDPVLGSTLAKVKPHPGTPRAEVTVPIAPGDVLADTMIFDAPDGFGQKFYLPRYSIASRATDQGVQLQVLLSRHGAGTRLSIAVQPSMPPEVRAAAPDATPLEHETIGVLAFEVAGGGMKREWLLADSRALPDGHELSVVLPDIVDRDEVYHALTSASAGATFTVRRTFTVAVPTGTAPASPGIRPRFPVRARVRPTAADRAVVFREATVHPALVVKPGLIGWVPPAITVDVPAGGSEPLFRATTRSLDQVQTPRPFVFSKDLHPYIYGDITAAASQGGLVLEQLAFGGRHHSYYFAQARPGVVYYLPDAFKLARAPEAPHPPMMSVAFETSDGAPENTDVTVAFAASAVAAPDRLLEAAKTLAGRAGVGVETMDLQPFLADSSRLALRVSLPGTAGASTLLEDARIDLRTALSAGFRLPLTGFMSMFDRLNGAAPRLFDGEVEVRLDRPDRAAEKVPLIVDMADLAGPLVEIVPARTDAGYQVTVTNIVESPLRLDALVAHLPQTDGALSCELRPATTGTMLAPGESVTAEVVPVQPPAEADVLPEVSVAEATVTPDAARIWDALCDDTTSYLSREIIVKAPAQLFAPAADGTRIVAVLVEVGGQTGGLTRTVELGPEQMAATATVNLPIADLVLRSRDAGEYRYRVHTVRTDRETTGDWKKRSSEILWIVDASVV